MAFLLSISSRNRYFALVISPVVTCPVSRMFWGELKVSVRCFPRSKPCIGALLVAFLSDERLGPIAVFFESEELLRKFRRGFLVLAFS
jgi:hypothetical protein